MVWTCVRERKRTINSRTWLRFDLEWKEWTINKYFFKTTLPLNCECMYVQMKPNTCPYRWNKCFFYLVVWGRHMSFAFIGHLMMRHEQNFQVLSHHYTTWLGTVFFQYHWFITGFCPGGSLLIEWTALMSCSLINKSTLFKANHQIMIFVYHIHLCGFFHFCSQ